MKLLLFLHLFFVEIAFGAWQDGVEIKSHLRRDELDILGSFDGHHEDHLSILKWNAESIFIGARDALFNLSSRDLKQKSMLNWTVSSDHQEMCQIKGQKDSECHNFLRIFHGPIHHHHHKSNDQNTSEHFMVCGTNAYKPICRYYDSELMNFTQEFVGTGYTPYSPTHKSTSVLHHGSVYSGTVADFGGTDALIYKAPLRTEQYDLKHLYSPAFVSSMSYGDFAFFFFKEFAVEFSNCGKAVFSRIGRICRHDSGSRKHKDRFTTYLKARLNCSVPGEYPFYFDHIQGTTDIFIGNGKNSSVEMMYAVFTTPENSLVASAVCAFTMKDILQVFQGPFKGQSTFDSNWLPVSPNNVPYPRPGSCSNDTSYYPDSNSVAFHKSHPIMDEAVQGKIVLTYTSNKLKFTAIAHDISSEITPYHILYIGTDTGRVLKAVINASSGIPSELQSEETLDVNYSVIAQSWSPFEGKGPIRAIRLLSLNKLLVSTEIQILILKVDNCEKFSKCSQCIEIRDPHCAWNMDTKLCVAKNSEILSKNLDFKLIQDVSSGDSNLCLPDERNNEIVEINHVKSINQEDEEECCPCSTSTPRLTANENRIPESEWKGELSTYLDGGELNEKIIISAENESSKDNEIIPHQQDFKSSYVKSEDGTISSQSIVIATVSSAILSLLIGFSLGFIASRWLNSRMTKLTEPSTNALTTLNESKRLTKSIDFLVNVYPTNKNPMKNNFNTEETLEKTKKVYL